MNLNESKGGGKDNFECLMLNDELRSKDKEKGVLWLFI